ncbi:hypothetical protein BST81_23625 [Leptolyngbya sp. 'hensonii']|nr:hypothetical protein BST81_23625 [Leptolyngbya sp. 'hensonii']
MSTSTAVEFCLEKELKFILAECDRVNPDTARIYRPNADVLFAYFSEDPNKRAKADPVVKAAVDSSLVLCNLPAQSYQAMKDWFIEDGLYELGQEYNIAFYHWYVSNGGYDSVQIFIKSLKELGSYMQHIFVRNWGLCDDWTHVEDHRDMKAARAEYNFPIIDLPKLPYAERNFIEDYNFSRKKDEDKLTFTSAVTHPELSLVSRKRIKNFLRDSFAQIESTGILSDEKP